MRSLCSCMSVEVELPSMACMPVHLHLLFMATEASDEMPDPLGLL